MNADKTIENTKGLSFRNHHQIQITNVRNMYHVHNRANILNRVKYSTI